MFEYTSLNFQSKKNKMPWKKELEVIMISCDVCETSNQNWTIAFRFGVCSLDCLAMFVVDKMYSLIH